MGGPALRPMLGEVRRFLAQTGRALHVIEAPLRQTSGADSAHARPGAVSFIHRFGASLNRHVHFHCCVIDGVFEPVADTSGISEAVRFRPATALTPKAIAAIAEQVRLGVLRWFARPALVDPDDVRAMLTWENSGFSLDASVRVAAQDRAGLERLLRYCARPPFALERLVLLDEERVVYLLPKPQRDGTTALTLTPLELIDHLAAQLVHRLATAQAAPPSLPLTCPNCGADRRIIAFVTDAAPVERILTHSGEPPRPPPSPLPVDRPTGSRRPSRPRTGTSSPNQTPVWRLTNGSSGNRRRLSWTAPAPISLP